MRSAILFAGPSTFGLSNSTVLQHGIELLPPARRGDIERMVRDADAPGVAILCDGIFHSQPTVSHAELCLAIDEGWQVWGVSSLGAIRAYEMRDHGMHGFGYVYALFARIDDLSDDEMGVLHFPEPPYFPVSEALVNLRYALDQLRDPLGISDAAEGRLIDELKGLWFGDRTEQRIRDAMTGRAGLSKDVADRLLTWLRSHRIKTIDLETLLLKRPWEQETPSATRSG